MSRAHLNFAATDENGDLYRYVQVTVQNDDGSKFAGRIYRDRISSKEYSNPFVAAPGMIDVYFAGPVQVKLSLIYDLAKAPAVTGTIVVPGDATQTVQVNNPLLIQDPMPRGALLNGIDPNDAWWKPMRVPHEHAGAATGSLIVGPTERRYRQAGTFGRTTTVGGNAGGHGAATSLWRATMLGRSANAYGRHTVAIGRDTLAAEAAVNPWADGAVALGREASAQDSGVAVGVNASADQISGDHATLSLGAVALGRDTQAGPAAVALGTRATPGNLGIAIGRDAGTLSNGPSSSIGLGAGAQYGLPSDSVNWAVMLGASDPARRRTMPWTNPASSQSESPWDEYAPTMSFTGRTVQIQRHLTWEAKNAAVQVLGSATLGGPGGNVGFYGTPAVPKPSVADDEPLSGIEALDRLIYALRSLGLIKFRSQASMLYRAEDLQRTYLHGDQVAAWLDHFGFDAARYVTPGMPPTFDNHNVHDPAFNGGPVVAFDNSFYRRSTKPLQELRGGFLLPRIRHFIVVASHRDITFGAYEGLLNLDTGTDTTDNNVLSASGVGVTTWDRTNIARYDRDGLDQSTNLDAGLPAPHIYRVTDAGGWPHARPIIGGPRDQKTSGQDPWSGSIAEVVGLDESWEEQHVRSLVRGMAFRYGINQDLNQVQLPARDFMIRQHDPASGPLVFWSQDYDDGFLGRVSGRVTRMTQPVIYIPFISIYIEFDFFLFRGSLLGNWGNISLSAQYEVQISIHNGEIEEDIDVAWELDVSVEREVGIFSLNNNLTWTMGRINIDYGHKICRIRHRVTKEVICISGQPGFQYADTEVRVYSTQANGTLKLEGTSPLWGDGTFSVKVRTAGHKVARVYRRSTNTLIASTEWQEFALPRTLVIASGDPNDNTATRDQALAGEAAVTGVAFCDLDDRYRYRARHLGNTLAKVQNDNGSINWSYSSSAPVKSNPPAGQDLGTEWTVIFWVRYQVLMNDARFLANATKGGDWIIANLANGSFPNTTRTILAYFALRDLGFVSGQAKYSTAAATVKAALLANHWMADQNRFREDLGRDREALEATAFGGLFLLAIGDRTRATYCLQALKRFKTKTAQISAAHYTGPSGLVGYVPYANGGPVQGYVNPPNTIYQAGTWVAILFKMRYGEPVGDDIDSLMRWHGNQITGDPQGKLYGAQFITQSTAWPAYSIYPQPNQGAAAWAYLLSRGARDMFLADPLPVPAVGSLAMTMTLDPASSRLFFRYTWTGSAPCAAFEAVPEQSTDGTNWTPATPNTITGSVEPVRLVPGGAESFAASWTAPNPGNPAMRYRIRVRLRNASFGAWSTSNVVNAPSS